eukprot:Em0676g1a
MIKKLQLAAPRWLQRMLLQLQQYDLNVVYVPVSQQVVADTLSRAPVEAAPKDTACRDDVIHLGLKDAVFQRTEKNMPSQAKQDIRAHEIPEQPWAKSVQWQSREWRNTPTSGMGSSPNQRLFSRRTRGGLVTSQERLKPEIQEDMWEHKIRKQQNRQRPAKVQLEPIQVGQPVLVQDWLSRKTQWKRGRWVDQLSDRSYIVDMDDQILRRNRVFLRPSSHQPDVDAEDRMSDQGPTQVLPAQNVGNPALEVTTLPREAMTVEQEVSTPVNGDQLREGSSVNQHPPAAVENFLLTVTPVVVTQVPNTVQAQVAQIPNMVQAQVAQIPNMVQAQVAQIPNTVQAQVAQIPNTVQAQVAQIPNMVQAQVAQIPNMVQAQVAPNSQHGAGPSSPNSQHGAGPSSPNSQHGAGPSTHESAPSSVLSTCTPVKTEDSNNDEQLELFKANETLVLHGISPTRKRAMQSKKSFAEKMMR